VAEESEASKRYHSLISEKGGRLRWWHKVDAPRIQALTADGFMYAELSWPGLASHRRSVAVGECEDGKYRFEGASPLSNDVRIIQEGLGNEVGQIKIILGKPSQITLSNGHSYSLRNEGFMREEWVLVDENDEPIFRVKRIYMAVEDSGEVETLNEGSTKPPMLLLMMAAWYVVH